MDNASHTRPVLRRSEVLKKLNSENVQLLERGLLRDLPDRFKPQTFTNVKGPVRGDIKDLVVSKPSGILASCLPVIPASPSPTDKLTTSDDDVSPLKKSFSFRERFSRISFLGKEKQEKQEKKWATIIENERMKDIPSSEPPKHEIKYHHETKIIKRVWLFRNKELVERRQKQRPAYARSKSFEFLPKALKEDSYAFGSSDTMGDAWSSTDSLENISNVYYDNDRTVYLKSFKELPTHDSSKSSNNNSSLSTVNSASSGIVVNMLKTKSIQDLLDEFDKTVDMFSENYLSDCEPYTRNRGDVPVKEKRKSSSFSNLPSPKLMQVNKVSKISDAFKTELSQLLEVKRVSDIGKNPRRGSVTDWFVLEDKGMSASCALEENKYRREQKKPTQRVRRISSTKYVSNISLLLCV